MAQSPRKGGRLITRRQFLGATVAAGAAASVARTFLSRSGPLLRVPRPNKLKRVGDLPLLAVAEGLDAEAVTRLAVDALGGMSSLVQSGDIVVVKPNCAWDCSPEQAANTNPLVVKATVQMCQECGAREVRVFDHTCLVGPEVTYERSGLTRALASLERPVRPLYVDKRRFRMVKDIRSRFGARKLDEWPFYEDALDCDVFINVPVLKHHRAAGLTMGMKNLFGVVGGDRGRLHRDIHQMIADVNAVVPVDLTVLDATRVLMRNGPTGGRITDVENKDQVIASADRVAVDAYGAELFGFRQSELPLLAIAEGMRLGCADYRKPERMIVRRL